MAQASHISHFQSGGRTIAYEVLSETSHPGTPLLILLPGTSGPEAPLYRSQADYFTHEGFTVLLLHYFDASDSRLPSDENYQLWVAALSDLVHEIGEMPDFKGRAIDVLGFSLGSSIALAAGSQLLPVRAIAEWYGSLPDKYFYQLQGMPPLLILHGQRDSNIPVSNAEQLVRLCELKKFTCSSHLYPGESHGFSNETLRDADLRTLAFFKEH
jgi:dienelactone hydrolase